jgi:hypothetical protein
MNRLTKLSLAALAAATAVGATAPASAAHWNFRSGYTQDIVQLSRQIDRAERHNLLSHREANRFERKIDQLRNLHRIFARNGFSRAERHALEVRIDVIERQLARELRDRDHRRSDRRNDWGKGRGR